MLDCLIIGAGPAGLTAAIYLGRFLRKTAIIDAGSGRANLIPSTHNLPGYPEGIAGKALLDRLRRHAALYGVSPTEDRIETLTMNQGAFLAKSRTQQWEARTVILATGVKDRHPDVAGLSEATQAGLVRWCPICDGFEARDQDIGVVAPGDSGPGHALFLRTYSDKVSLLVSGGESTLDAGDRARLEEAGVEIVTQSVDSIQPQVEEKCVLVELGDGTSKRFDVIYPMQGADVQSQLATRLGAACRENGDLLVDEGQRTTVPGLYAVGDVICAINQIASGMGHAVVAATRIHNELPPNPRASVG